MIRLDGIDKVTGQARYAGDTRGEGALDIAVAVTSAQARCRVSIDDAAASAVNGVRLIVTHRNAPRLHHADAISGSELGTHLPLQSDRVAYIGECIALIVADNLQAARTAASLLAVTYTDVQDELAVTCLSQADERLERVTVAGTANGVIKRGKPGRKRSENLVTFDATYRTSPLHHNAMEPGAVVAAWEDDGSLLISAPVQWTEMAALAVAQVFGFGWRDTFPGTLSRVAGISNHRRKVLISPTFAGGAFGRNNSELFLVLAAIAAKLNCRPVRFELPRKDTFTLMPCRGETRTHLRILADQNGRLLEFTGTLDAALGTVGKFIEPIGEGMANVYACPDLKIEHRIARLDHSATGWMRAPGLASGMFALESAMNELAAELAIDPLELRRLNHSDVDPETGKRWSSKSLLQCYDAGAEAIGWSARGKQREPRADGRLIGYGMAGAFHPNRQFPASARVTLHPDGTAEVETCVAELGQGLLTALAIIAAEALGLQPSDIRVRWSDAEAPPGGPTFASAGTLSNGAAVDAAARKVRKAFIAAVSAGSEKPHHQADVTIVDGVVTSAGGRETVAMAMARLRARSFSAQVTRGLNMPIGRRPSGQFGAIFAMVSVDLMTMQTRVERMVGAFACGRVVNEPVLRGQLIGAMTWGIGHALLERSHLDPRTGGWVNDNLAEALVPTHLDSCHPDVVLIDEDDRANHRSGIKGGGEIGLVGAAAAIADGIFNATGQRHRTLPITSEQMLAAAFLRGKV